jgi:transposase
VGNNNAVGALNCPPERFSRVYLCMIKRADIRPGTFYAWTKEFMEAGKERLTRDSIRDATRQEIESLKRENHDLKELVADLSLEVYRFKKTAIPALENTSV